MIPGAFPIVAGASAPPSLTFLGSAVGSSQSAFNGMNFGSARADRYIVAAVGNGGSVPSGITIGGVAATLIASSNGANGNFHAVTSIWVALVPSGTSGDVTFASALGDTGVALYALTGLTNSGAASNTATDVWRFNNDPMVATIDVPSTGVAIACAYTDSSGGLYSWTGLTVVDANTRFDVISGIGTTFSAGNITGASGAVSVTAGYLGTYRSASLTVASFA